MDKKQQLRKHIKNKELQIKKLHLHLTSADICNQLYNTLILEKAVLRKQLEELEKNTIFETIKRILSKKEKLICDYFKN